MAGKGTIGNWGNRNPKPIPEESTIKGRVKPGEKRNPLGLGGHRSSIRRELQESAEQMIATSTGKHVTRKEALVACAWKLALEGDLRAIMFITEQIDGKLPDKVHLSGEGGGPIVIRYVNDWRTCTPESNGDGHGCE